MLVVVVRIHVKPECVTAFVEATKANARASLQEPGIAQFDFLQEPDDPTSFVLIEAYRDEQAPAKHKETTHYAAWRDAVAPMMAEPRQSMKYRSLHPPDAEW
jgi:quinol monooxygenase YgiN